MTILYPELTEEFRLSRLQPPTGKVNMVLDTDTFNEIDDQFALVHALLSPDKINLQAIYAAPFFNELSNGPKDGMEKSYDEIIRIVARLNKPSEGYVYKGSETYLPGKNKPVDSPAARDLIAKALAAPDDEPLYITAIGAITNVASAILLEPRIIEKIVVVWLGGHALQWPDANEFNLKQDVSAAQVIFDSGVPLVLVPCLGVASHLLTTLSEINTFVRGKGAIGDFLAERYESCAEDHFGYSRVIWDIATIAYFTDPDALVTELVHSPVLNDGLTWSHDASRHFIRYTRFVKRDIIFKSLFHKLDRHAASQD
ncbi:nucleoside hydrolase [Paenibacillaceae bacterium]|nr:nucleoside hydrolase [Paenibacillaceae bacterium]